MTASATDSAFLGSANTNDPPMTSGMLVVREATSGTPEADASRVV
jgi:hypothetical protein